MVEIWNGFVKAIELIVTLDGEVLQIAGRSLSLASASTLLASIICLPLASGPELLGWMHVAHNSPGYFDGDVVEVLTIYGRMVGTAVASLRLLVQNSRQAKLDPLTGGLKDLADARQLLNDAFAEGVIEDEMFDRLNAGIDRATSSLQDLHNVFRNMLADSINALGEVANLFHQDSIEAEALRSVIQILNVVMGINAVIKQLNSGDPYSAIPRAIGVAALIASMGVDTGASGGGAPQRTRQETQGTGSVLGVAQEKTESILNATEITAKATSELVGINRGMLQALQTLQLGLSGAAVQLARGSTGDFEALPDFSDVAAKWWALGPLASIFDSLGFGFINDIFNKIFGGKTKLIDEGIRILGGTLDDVINNIIVQAFQIVNVKKHLFDDFDLSTRFQDLDSDINHQFSLVFASIRDTVTEAAIALGIPMDIIEERMASFIIATQEISLLDLTAEEAREELLAVFGEVFDDLAKHIIPFISQFQKVGEARA